MNVKIFPSILKGEIAAIPSKSYAHRILFASLLANSPLKINNLFDSQDILATKGCVDVLKGVLYENLSEFSSENGEKIAKTPEDEVVLDCFESGSTLRFLLPIVAALGIKAKIIGAKRLSERPNKPLITALLNHSIKINGTFPYRISGKLSAGDFEIEGSVSSQFVSGLLLALPILNGDSKIILTSPLQSVDYVEITLDVMKKFGVFVEKTDFGYFVKGNQKYVSPNEITVEGDWSNAAFWLVAGAFGDVKISGLNLDSVQGDKAILNILKRAQAKISFENGAIRVQKTATSMLKLALTSLSIDAQNIPDLVPILSVLLSKAAISRIFNVERLKIKESDRLLATIKNLKKFNVKCGFFDKKPLKTGIYLLKSNFKGTEAEGFNDHRMVMSATILASFAKGETVITDAEAVKKSYPNFFEDFQSLGGKYEFI